MSSSIYERVKKIMNWRRVPLRIRIYFCCLVAVVASIAVPPPLLHSAFAQCIPDAPASCGTAQTCCGGECSSNCCDNSPCDGGLCCGSGTNSVCNMVDPTQFACCGSGVYDTTSQCCLAGGTVTSMCGATCCSTHAVVLQRHLLRPDNAGML